MLTRIVFCVLMISSVRGGDTKSADISQFWADDYKIFDKIYGRTSDKDLYGATLPPTIRFDAPKHLQIGVSASDKNERYFTHDKNILDSDIPFDFSDRYAKIFPKSHTGKTKPLQFVSLGDSKPISKATDPETYNYLKNLEKKAKKKETSKIPFADAEENDAYKSIQDILDAHEANKGKEDSTEELPKKKREDDRRRNRSKVRFINNNSIKSRCVSGRCRSPVRSRPYLKIKRYRYTTR